MKIRVSNIQRFSLHDGNGIRTTIFLKGCSLHCPWCANPENVKFSESYFFDKSKCLISNSKEKCVINKDCDGFSIRENMNCPAVTIIGKDYLPKDLVKEIEKDKFIYSENGGVTFSGGEPLLNSDALLPLLKTLKKKKINITIETSLSVDLKNIKNTIKYVDYFFVDVKTFNEKLAINALGLKLDNYKENLTYLFKNFNRNKITLRMPLVPGFNDDEKGIHEIGLFLKNLGVINFELFSVHNLGKEKYALLREKYIEFETADNTELIRIKRILCNYIKNVTIIKL